MIFFDFDGTIVDVWERYSAVFSDAAHIRVPIEEYIAVKKEKQRDEDIAAVYRIYLPNNYFQQKRRLLEDERYLSTDKLLISAQKLINFFDRYACRILTSRRNKEAFYYQMEKLGLGILNAQTIVLDPDDKISKREHLRNTVGKSKIIAVGDSRAEWEIGELPDSMIYLVKTGLFDPEKFPYRHNCKVISDIEEFIDNYREENV